MYKIPAEFTSGPFLYDERGSNYISCYIPRYSAIEPKHYPERHRKRIKYLADTFSIQRKLLDRMDDCNQKSSVITNSSLYLTEI